MNGKTSAIHDEEEGFNADDPVFNVFLEAKGPFDQTRETSVFIPMKVASRTISRFQQLFD
jgi:hypothetical protein